MWRRNSKVLLPVLVIVLFLPMAVVGAKLIRPPDWYLSSYEGTTAAAFDSYRTALGPIFLAVVQIGGASSWLPLAL